MEVKEDDLEFQKQRVREREKESALLDLSQKFVKYQQIKRDKFERKVQKEKDGWEKLKLSLSSVSSFSLILPDEGQESENWFEPRFRITVSKDAKMEDILSVLQIPNYSSVDLSNVKSKDWMDKINDKKLFIS